MAKVSQINFSNKISTLKKRKSFLHVKNNSKSVVTKNLVAQVLPSTDDIKFGFTATKKIGKATVRNRAKRRIRSLVRQNMTNINQNCHIVFIARSNTATCNWDDLVENFNFIIKSINNFQRQPLK